MRVDVTNRTNLLLTNLDSEKSSKINIFKEYFSLLNLDCLVNSYKLFFYLKEMKTLPTSIDYFKNGKYLSKTLTIYMNEKFFGVFIVGKNEPNENLFKQQSDIKWFKSFGRSLCWLYAPFDWNKKLKTSLWAMQPLSLYWFCSHWFMLRFSYISLKKTKYLSKKRNRNYLIELVSRWYVKIFNFNVQCWTISVEFSLSTDIIYKIYIYIYIFT